MESKQTKPKPQPTPAPFNRTSMESKLTKLMHGDSAEVTAFNRTSMESKLLFTHDNLLLDFMNLLIEPVWNRNFTGMRGID